MHQSVDDPKRCSACDGWFKAIYVDTDSAITFWYWCRTCDELRRGE